MVKLKLLNDTRISDFKVHHLECPFFVSYPLGLVKRIRMQLTKIAELYTNMAQWTKTSVIILFVTKINKKSKKDKNYKLKLGTKSVRLLSCKG